MSDWRQYCAIGIVRPSSFWYVVCHSAYGPAQIAVRYELIVGVGAKVQRLACSAGLVPSVPSSVIWSVSSVRSTGMFDVTIHEHGASTENVKTALRSGWSKTA